MISQWSWFIVTVLWLRSRIKSHGWHLDRFFSIIPFRQEDITVELFELYSINEMRRKYFLYPPARKMMMDGRMMMRTFTSLLKSLPGFSQSAFSGDDEFWMVYGTIWKIQKNFQLDYSSFSSSSLLHKS